MERDAVVCQRFSVSREQQKLGLCWLKAGVLVANFYLRQVYHRSWPKLRYFRQNSEISPELGRHTPERPTRPFSKSPSGGSATCSVRTQHLYVFVR